MSNTIARDGASRLAFLSSSLFWRRRTRRHGARKGRWRGRPQRRDQHRFCRGWQLVGIGYQEGQLPHLSFRKRFAETGHAAQANAVEDLPVAFARLIVGHALSLE